VILFSCFFFFYYSDRRLFQGKERGQKDEERKRTIRRQERSLGMRSSSSADDDVVSQWLERTAAPPPLSANDCQIQATEYALAKYTTANASSSYSPLFLKSMTASRVGAAFLQLSRDREQCLGVWPREESLDSEEERVYADSLRRVNGEGHLKQAIRVLKEAIQSGLSSSNFSSVGYAAKELADCYGCHSARESAKYLSLWQSCKARSGMMDMYNKACRPTARETSFVRRVADASGTNKEERK
jgi:hypothetical protein